MVGRSSSRLNIRYKYRLANVGVRYNGTQHILEIDSTLSLNTSCSNSYETTIVSLSHMVHGGCKDTLRSKKRTEESLSSSFNIRSRLVTLTVCCNKGYSLWNPICDSKIYSRITSYVLYIRICFCTIVRHVFEYDSTVIGRRCSNSYEHGS